MRSTITHELMHCHINSINELAEEHLEELAPKTFQERKKGLDYVNERVTDSLAEMVCNHLTLPKLPSRGNSKTLSHTLSQSRTLKSNKKNGNNSNRKNGSVKNKSGGAKKQAKRRK